MAKLGFSGIAIILMTALIWIGAESYYIVQALLELSSRGIRRMFGWML